jgi:hypothetical protein
LTIDESLARRGAASSIDTAAKAATPGTVAQPAAQAPARVRPHTRLAAAPSAPPAPAPPDPPPTIQVSIGRVEVRAARQPEPAPRQARATSASMSLDEYLRQRNGGGAR